MGSEMIHIGVNSKKSGRCSDFFIKGDSNITAIEI